MPLFEWIKNAISFVQMKLFISISGYLLAYKCLKEHKQAYGEYVKSKVIRLLVPYIFVLILYNDPLKFVLGIQGYERPIPVLIDQLLGTNCAHLWYLPCLFLLLIITYPILIWAGKNLWKHCALFVAFLSINYFSPALPRLYQLNEVAYYLIFFYVGYMINYFRTLYPELIKKTNKWLLLSAMIVLFGAVGYLIRCFTSIGFELYLSIVVLFLFYKFIPKSTNTVIDDISRRSYGVYLFHSPMIYITACFCPNIDPWLMLFINFVCFGDIAYFMTVAISKSKLKFILGE